MNLIRISILLKVYWFFPVSEMFYSYENLNLIIRFFYSHVKLTEWKSTKARVWLFGSAYQRSSICVNRNDAPDQPEFTLWNVGEALFSSAFINAE